MWTKTRTESSFYDDLKEAVINIVGVENLIENYQANVPNSQDYVIDFKIETNSKDLCICLV